MPTVDMIIEVEGEAGAGIILIERLNSPAGWAIPGGFVEYGESLEDAARREAEEEVSLRIELLGQLGSYSDPRRDPRFHTISTAFVARAKGAPKAASDAKAVGVFTEANLPRPLAFDHARILADYFAWKRGKCPLPAPKG
jgi:ADP-ribose pyrophosphatase YjhB (NUDIX family)